MLATRNFSGEPSPHPGHDGHCLCYCLFPRAPFSLCSPHCKTSLPATHPAPHPPGAAGAHVYPCPIPGPQCLCRPSPGSQRRVCAYKRVCVCVQACQAAPWRPCCSQCSEHRAVCGRQAEPSCYGLCQWVDRWGEVRLVGGLLETPSGSQGTGGPPGASTGPEGSWWPQCLHKLCLWLLRRPTPRVRASVAVRVAVRCTRAPPSPMPTLMGLSCLLCARRDPMAAATPETPPWGFLRRKEAEALLSPSLSCSLPPGRAMLELPAPRLEL